MSIDTPQSHGATNQHSSTGAKAQRAKRTKEHGPIGFQHVMHNVKASAKGAHAHAATKGSAAHTLATDPHDDDTQGAQAQQPGGADTTTTALQFQQAMTAGASDIAHLFHSHTAAPSTQSLTIQQATAQQNQLDSAQQRLNTHAALQQVAREAMSVNATANSRTLRIQLEPEHLGPLVVKMRLTDEGKLTTELHVTNPEAAAKLQSGSSDLRDRLAAIGHPDADIVIGVQPDEYFDD